MATVPALASDTELYEGLRRRVSEHAGGDVDPQLVAGIRTDTIAAAFALVLAGAGWRIESLPGQPVACILGDRRCEPFLEVEGLSEAAERQGWPARLAELGLDPVFPLVPAAP